LPTRIIVTAPFGPHSASSAVDDRLQLADHLDMRRLNSQIATIAEAHPFPYAIVVGLAAGVLALLVGWLARREWIWFLFIVATAGAGATAYTRARRDQQGRTRLERDRQHPP
jgi:hypothetical protein